MAKGLSSVKTLTAREIAKKHNLPLAVIAKKIAAGVKVEKEHTKSTRQANEIARDHLGERPDYYDKLHKMEKTKVVKEETTTNGIGGLGFRTGTPAIDDDNEYVSTNALAYDPLNGARLDFIKKIHNRLHKEIGFNYFDPTNKNHSNKELSEARLNELGEYDNKGGTKDAEGLSDPHPRVLRKDVSVKEDLRKWFREKWVRFDTKGNIKGPCAREEGEGKPKCQPLASARSMSKDERAKSARRKRREDPVANRPGKGGKPIMVRTDEETLLEKNVPTNPELWARAKSQAKAKFDVYPSAYANGWAAKWYKSKGGGWKSAANESVDEACWSGYVAKGMKKKGNKMVPNCVPVEEQSPANRSYTERPIYERGKTPADMAGAAERGIYQEEVSDAQVDRYLKGIGGTESGGTKNPYAAKSKRSSAEGKYQYIGSTWRNVVRQYGGQGDTKKYPTASSAPPEYQEKIARSDARGAIEKFGERGAVLRHFTGNPAGKMSPKAQRANPGVTPDTYVKRFEKFAGKADTPAPTQVAKAPEPVTPKPSMMDTIKSKIASAASSMSLTGTGGASAKPSEPVTSKAPEPAKAPEPQGKFDVSFASPEDDKKIKSAATPPTPSQSSSDTYTVKKGDTLSGIAKTYGSDVGSLAKSSNISDPNKIMPGQSINIPKSKSVSEATYQGKKVALNKPMKGDVKKSKVYVDPDGDGKAQKVNFGDKKLSIKKDQPNRKKSYCARSGGITGKKDVTSANYWSRKAWNCEEETVNEISAELVGKVSNARFFRGEAPSRTLNRAIVKKFIESGKKKEETKKDMKEFWTPFITPHHKHSARLSKEKSNKPDIIMDPGAGGTIKTIHEELKMDSKELINEALDSILEDNLSEMKDNLMLALQEKAMEKLEERKKEIAASYFAQ